MSTERNYNLVKMKSSSGIRDGSSAKTKFDPSVIKNKVVSGSSTKQSIDSKHKFSSTTTTTTTSNVSKIEAKGKSILSSSKTKTTTKTVKSREKKVYSLPGQKYDVPEEREPLRIFYESLSKQIPSSEMAEFWMMEHGMLSPERAKKAYEKKQRRQKEIRMGTPVKSQPPPPPSRPETSKKPQPFSPPNRGGESSKKPLPPPQPVSKNGDAKANKRILEDSSEDDDDFVLSHKRRKG
ncbi:uncharacterized protein LOC111907088 [Lactuca sativa]|uniref:Uncharacterized protein n=1 Tax=Lactuca sativa TaxID=4236 RepID=A0A9R1VII8_LACSA|nr:uncharacterized protein LOC111907088 [Lactuca sativa]KAJ0206971.1 hypothetical protein LSAT_V11C500240450 [Lactuca sativa]